MVLRYDREEDILTIELNPTGTIDHAEEVGTMILHLDADERPVLLEILQAGGFLSGLVKASVRAEPVTI